MLVKMNEATSTINDLLPKVETWATVFSAIGLLKVPAAYVRALHVGIYIHTYIFNFIVSCPRSRNCFI